MKEFRGRGGLTFGNNATTFDFDNRRIGLYAGMQILSASGVSGFVEGFGDYGKSDPQRGAGGRAGLRIALYKAAGDLDRQADTATGHVSTKRSIAIIQAAAGSPPLERKAQPPDVEQAMRLDAQRHAKSLERYGSR